MGGLVVQICRADDDDRLQVLIGAAVHHWGKMGFTKINVVYVSNDDTQAGVYTMTNPNELPKKMAVDQGTDHTAVLVLTTP